MEKSLNLCLTPQKNIPMGRAHPIWNCWNGINRIPQGVPSQPFPWENENKFHNNAGISRGLTGNAQEGPGIVTPKTVLGEGWKLFRSWVWGNFGSSFGGFWELGLWDLGAGFVGFGSWDSGILGVGLGGFWELDLGILALFSRVGCQKRPWG